MSLNLIVSRVLAGRSVLAVDGDRQGSLIAALANRESPIPSAHYPEGKILRQQVSLAREKYDDILWLTQVSGHPPEVECEGLHLIQL